MTRCKYLIDQAGEYKEALQKRCDELRHYLNIIIEARDEEEEHQNDQESQKQQWSNRTQILQDQRFYKKISQFNNICSRYFKSDYQKLLTQQVGSVDQEDSMREILSQMDLEILNLIYQNFHLNVPSELELRYIRAASQNPDLSLEELMCEVLIEENHLKRYEDIKLSDISLLPNEEDLWPQGGQKNVLNVLAKA